MLSDPANSDYLIFLSNAYWLRLGIAFLLIGCMAVICVLWYTQEEEQENRQRKNDAEKLSRDAELYKLRQQLQPHFLFNSLNSISALIGSDPTQARKMIHQLIRFPSHNTQKRRRTVGKNGRRTCSHWNYTWR